METKTHIRKEILEKRNALSIKCQEEKSIAITSFLIRTKEFINSDLILLYKDYKNEVKTDEIYECALSFHKTVAYPRVSGDEMDFYIVSSSDQLKEGYKGIFEPDENCKMIKCHDIANKNVLMVLPGAAFDLSGSRIGYGKGFYDKYLNRMPYMNTMALAYAFQVLDEIPTWEHDKKVEYIVTENGRIVCKGE